MKLIVEIGGREIVVDTAAPHDVEQVEPGVYSILRDGRSYEVRVTPDEVLVNGRRYTVEVRDPRKRSRRRHGLELEGRVKVVAPMPGKVVRVLVAVGDTVEKGQGIVVVEAMKMQNEIKSPKAGTIVSIEASEGARVNAGDALLTVE